MATDDMLCLGCHTRIFWLGRRARVDKVKAWLAKGALPTDRVLRFLDQAGVMKREPRNNPSRALPRKERKAQEEAKKAAAGAAPAAAPAAKKEEKPAEAAAS